MYCLNIVCDVTRKPSLSIFFETTLRRGRKQEKNRQCYVWNSPVTLTGHVIMLYFLFKLDRSSPLQHQSTQREKRKTFVGY